MWSAVPSCRCIQWYTQCFSASLRLVLNSSNCIVNLWICRLKLLQLWESYVLVQFCPRQTCLCSYYVIYLAGLSSASSGVRNIAFVSLTRNFLICLFLVLQLISSFNSSSFIQLKFTEEFSSRPHREFALSENPAEQVTKVTTCCTIPEWDFPGKISGFCVEVAHCCIWIFYSSTTHVGCSCDKGVHFFRVFLKSEFYWKGLWMQWKAPQHCLQPLLCNHRQMTKLFPSPRQWLS